MNTLFDLFGFHFFSPFKMMCITVPNVYLIAQRILAKHLIAYNVFVYMFLLFSMLSLFPPQVSAGQDVCLIVWII